MLQIHLVHGQGLGSPPHARDCVNLGPVPGVPCRLLTSLSSHSHLSLGRGAGTS